MTELYRQSLKILINTRNIPQISPGNLGDYILCIGILNEKLDLEFLLSAPSVLMSCLVCCLEKVLYLGKPQDPLVGSPAQLHFSLHCRRLGSPEPWKPEHSFTSAAWCAPLSSSRVTRAVETRTLLYIRFLRLGTKACGHRCASAVKKSWKSFRIAID
jgi:hypothetical protein